MNPSDEINKKIAKLEAELAEKDKLIIKVIETWMLEAEDD